MEVVSFVPQLGHALWKLKGMYDQHCDNKNEIKELQLFMHDYGEQIPVLERRFKQGAVEGNNVGATVLNQLVRDIVHATNKLQKWSTSKSFFRVLTSDDRMKKLETLHSKVMASVQKNLGIASLSTLIDVRDSQAALLKSNAELKSLVTACIDIVPRFRLPEVRAEAMEASRMSFADQKFWADVLAAVDKREVDETSTTGDMDSVFVDPITNRVMIDPVVASNGHTFCRWTIIDNSMKKDPYNPSEDLTILVDNLSIRPRLFEEFPERLEEFKERRERFRGKALALASKQLYGDAVVALKYVLQWDKNDKECARALVEVQTALKEEGAGGRSLQATKSKEKASISSLWEYKAMATLLGHRGDVVGDCIAWSPDGGRLATAYSNDNVVRVWDVKSGSVLASMEGFSSQVIFLAWNCDGNRVATQTRDTISLWNAVSGRRMYELKFSKNFSCGLKTEVTVSGRNDGVYLTLSCPSRERWGYRYDLLRFSELSGTIRMDHQNLSKYSGGVTAGSRCTYGCMSWNPDGVRVAIDILGVVEVLSFEEDASGFLSGRLPVPQPKRMFERRFVYRYTALVLAWSPDGTRLAAGLKSGKDAWVLDGWTGKLLTTLDLLEQGETTNIAWSSDGCQLLVTSKHLGRATVWDVKSGSKMFDVEAVAGCLAWSPKGGLLASACSNGRAAIWNPKTGEQLYSLKGHTTGIHSIVWSPEGDCLATGSIHGIIIVWGRSEVEAATSVVPAPSGSMRESAWSL